MALKKKSKKAIRNSAAKKPARTYADDIVEMILQDHKPLKKLLAIMKNSKKPFKERHAAFEEFGPLLTVHAKSEEQVLYVYMKKNSEMREEAFEGDVEHGLADQMAEESKRTNDEDLLGAKIKVLAELVEHHIHEEENDLLPDFRKHTDKETRVELGQRYQTMKTEIEDLGSDDAPPERKIREREAQQMI